MQALRLKDLCLLLNYSTVLLHRHFYRVEWPCTSSYWCCGIVSFRGCLACQTSCGSGPFPHDFWQRDRWFDRWANKSVWHPKSSTSVVWVGACHSWYVHYFLGVLIMTGLKKFPMLRDYWSSVPLLGCTENVESWPLCKFVGVLRCMHLNDNNTAIPRGQPGYDKLHKVRPFLELLQESFWANYKLDRDVSTDEAMVAFKGQVSFKHYKVWAMRSDSSTNGSAGNIVNKKRSCLKPENVDYLHFQSQILRQ